MVMASGGSGYKNPGGFGFSTPKSSVDCVSCHAMFTNKDTRAVPFWVIYVLLQQTEIRERNIHCYELHSDSHSHTCTFLISTMYMNIIALETPMESWSLT